MATLIERGNPGYSKQQMQIRKASGTSPVPVAPSTPIVPVNPNNQVASTIGGKQYNAGGGLINPANVQPTVAASSMGNTPAINVPTVPTQTNATGTNEFISSLNQTQKSDGQMAMDRQFEMDKAAAGSSKTDLQLAMGDAATQGAKREELYKQYGVDQLSTSVSEIQNRIDATERSRLAQISQLEKNPQGLFGGALNDEINRINRDFSKQQADDAITLNALTRNFTNMAAIADRQLEDYMAPIKANLDYQKEVAKTNEANFTQTQRDALQYKIAQDEKKTAKIEAEAKALSDTRLEALKSASEQGAGSDIIRDIQSAKTVDDVVKAAGKYGGDVMKRELLAQQIKTEKAQQSKYYADIKASGATGAVKPLSGEASKLLSISSGLETDVSAIKAKIASQGYEKFLRGYLTGTDRDTVKLLSRAADRVGRLRSGGAINKDEEERFIAQFASKGDYAFGKNTDATSALDSILTEAQSVRSGIDPNNTYSQPTKQIETPPNEFSAALGQTQKIQGSAIISGMNSDGSFNFNIPK